jgi:hypothetical protein
MSMYGHIFDSQLSEQEIEFESIVADLTPENMQFVIPMLLQLAVESHQRQRVREICNRMLFDIVALENGVHPDPLQKTIN